MKKERKFFKAKYTSVKKDTEIPLEVLCDEINLSLEMFRVANINQINNLTIEDILIEIDKGLIVPYKIYPGNVGPLQLSEEECIATLQAHDMNQQSVGVALNQEHFDSFLQAVRNLSQKYHIVVDIQQRKFKK